MLLSLIFERVWLDEQRVVAVRPKTPFVPSFERPTATAPLRSTARRRARSPEQGCAKSGSDGTRTRDLCRDRAAL
jgi:hypothetical protein